MEDLPLSLGPNSLSPHKAKITARTYHMCVALRKQLALYPRTILKKAGLQRILICEALYNGNLHLTGLTLRDEGIIFLNSETYRVANFRHDANRIFHHEFFHLVDGTVVGTENGYDETLGFVRDFEWEALSGEISPYSPRLGIVADDVLETRALKPGIWNFYALSSPKEDKAVLYSYMINEIMRIMPCAEIDGILARKIALIKRRLSSFDDYFDEPFWTLTARIARPPKATVLTSIREVCGL